MKMNVVLVEPEIPQNTGNIARTCAATGSVLHLVRPLGFEVTDKQLKRAGLDYWHLVDIRYYDNFDQLYSGAKGANFYFMTTKAKRVYSDVSFKDGDYLVFGRETRGLPEPLIEAHYGTALRIPMIDDARSLNLGNSVALTLYEALRQNGFEGLKTEGELTGRGY